MKIIKTQDSRNTCDPEQSVGVYYVVKGRTVGRFTFGKSDSIYRTCEEAFKAMREFLAGRKDAEELDVQLLPDHF